MNPFTFLRALIFKDIPIYVHYGITHRCNLQCRMCGVWKTGDRKTELTLPQIDSMAEILSEMGTRIISIGGGEPLIREDLPEVAKAFIRRGISPRILTNGVVDRFDRLQELIEAGVNNFSVSLDTLNPEIQNGIICRDDAFHRIMKTIRFLSPVVRKKGATGILNTVVSSANLDHLGDLVNFAEETGFYVSFVPLEIHKFSGQVLGCTDNYQDMLFNKDNGERILNAFADLIHMKSLGKPIFNSSEFLHQAGDYLSGRGFRWNCLAGRLYFSISPEGLFSVCHRYQGYSEEGNRISVLDPEFRKIWKSAPYSERIRQVQTQCKSCMRPCWAEISNLFTRPGSLVEMAKIYFLKKQAVRK